MTTNKPEIRAFLMQQDGYEPYVSIGRDSSCSGVTHPLIRLSDYEALQAECEQLRKDAERYQSLLEAVLCEIPHREVRRGNAPGHAHSVPGIWDEDNGALAGKECAWCNVWNEAVSAMQEGRNP